MMQGNVLGLEMGARVGHATLEFLGTIFGDEGLGKPVDDVFKDIVFGGGDDDFLEAPCAAQDSPVEVYGFYGNDSKSTSAVSLVDLLGCPNHRSPIRMTQFWNSTLTLTREIVALLASLVAMVLIHSELEQLLRFKITKLKTPLSYSKLLVASRHLLLVQLPLFS